MSLLLHRLPTLALALAALPTAVSGEDLSRFVNPLIGTTNRGNTFPGAVLPFGMVAFSPENTKGDHTKAAAPGGYLYESRGIRGFALTHLSGTGCAGASGDIPFMPFTQDIKTSPSADLQDRTYATGFSHRNETATPGAYKVYLEDGTKVELGATLRTGSARFSFEPGKPANLLIRTSDSEVGSFSASAAIDKTRRTVAGSVQSGNFCGYLNPITRRAYYTLYFVAEFDHEFASTGAWVDDKVTPGATEASGATGLDEKGWPAKGKGSGVWVGFQPGASVNVRIGISYVSLENARQNLAHENPTGTTLEAIQQAGREAWNRQLGRIAAEGGTMDQRTTFYTALYHSLLHPNVFSDVNGEYAGMDLKTWTVQSPQKVQYANFSGWDIYRSQVQLVAFLEPKIGADMAQSWFNQSKASNGKWDRWTHNNGETHVMNGDPAAPTVAGIEAFGGRDFDVKGAFESLAKAATVPAPDDLKRPGCPVMCPGQRNGLDQILKYGFLPHGSVSWGSVADMLEYVSADFSLSSLAGRLGDKTREATFLARANQWKNHWNPTATKHGGYLTERKADGTFAPDFKPLDDEGFVEGSGAQYVWMVPFNPKGLFEKMGGTEQALKRLDGFFFRRDGSLALTGGNGQYAEVDNEPSIGAPWLYAFAGRPDRTQHIVRQSLTQLWGNRPDGIPGNDDLGQMSSWYVWSALGFYPLYPGRADLILASPLFPKIRIQREKGAITITAPGARADAPYIQALTVNGQTSTRPWLPASFVEKGGSLTFLLGPKPHATWGRAAKDAPPSFDK